MQVHIMHVNYKLRIFSLIKEPAHELIHRLNPENPELHISFIVSNKMY